MEKESYTRTELYELLWTEPTTKVAMRIGISDVALGKWCKQYGIPKPPLGYWAKLEHGKAVPDRPPLEPWWNDHDPSIHVRVEEKAIMEARLNKLTAHNLLVGFGKGLHLQQLKSAIFFRQ